MVQKEKTSLIPLREANLVELKDKLQVPAYDRSKVGQSWVHLGVGAFHRAHQAVYQDELLTKNGPTEWGICGMSLLKNDTMIRDVLQKQDHLYTVIERTPAFDTPKIIGSIVNFHLVPETLEESIETLACEDTKIVSLTITESGYGISQETGDLDTSQADIKHDLESPFGECIGTYGFIASALIKRKERGLKPFTLLSCDNIQHNGSILKKMFLKFLELKDQDLLEWVKEYGAFPSSMVDRITPAFSKENLEILKEGYNLDDAWPVACEPFKQWVIEDNFPLGRPKWEEVGVQMVDDVKVYEKLKICVLNASHIAISFYSKICTYTYIDEALDDILLTRYVEALQDFEITPLLDPVPGINVEVYKQVIVSRFKNSALKDTVQRVSSDGTGKFTKFLYPIIQEAIEKGSEIELMVFTVACWCKLLTGVDEFGNSFPLIDPNADRLQAAAKKGGPDPTELLNQKDIFGDLGANKLFTGLLASQLKDIYEMGAQNAMEKLLAHIH